MKIILFMLIVGNLLANKVSQSSEDKGKDKSKNVILSVDEDGHKVKNGFTYWYYEKSEIGAKAFHNPIQFIVEGGLPGGKALHKVDLSHGMTEVFKRIANPIKYIDNYGWKKFLKYEMIPHTGDGENWVPNYVWHLWGGGFRTRMMIEYYHYHDYKYPKIWGWTTMYIMHLLNEASQMSSFQNIESISDDSKNDVVDSIPDLFFFDWVGGLLFSYDPINRFVTKHFHLSEWSYQSQINFSTARLLNNGQLYWMRYQLGSSPYSISILTGSQISGVGFAYELKKDHRLSLNVGGMLNSVTKDQNGDLIAESTVMTIGVSYSVKDNPWVVATLSLPDYRAMKTYPESKNVYNTRFKVNIYPGVINLFKTKLGFSFAYQRETFYFGITNGSSPLGLSVGHQRPVKY